MTILGNFNRRKNRENAFKAFSRKRSVLFSGSSFRKTNHTTVPVTQQPRVPSTNAIHISYQTAQEMERTVLECISSSSLAPTPTVSKLLMALRVNRRILQLHAAHRISLFQRLLGRSGNLLGSSGKRRAKEDAAMQRRYEFLFCLDKVEQTPSALTQVVASWQDMKDILSQVFVFPENTTEEEPEVDPGNDVEDSQKDNDNEVVIDDSIPKLQALLISDSLQPTPAGQKWKQVLQTPTTTQAALDYADRPFVLRLHAERRKAEATTRAKLVAELEARQRERQAQERAKSLLRPLTETEAEIVNRAMYGIGPPDEVVARVGTDEVMRQSLQTLQPGQWINDEVLHYFLVMLTKRDEELCQQDSRRKRSHFFKSFFVTKLLNVGDKTGREGQYEYKNVKRWSKKVPGKDLWGLDKIFFPINQGNSHWTCAVADMTNKKLQFYDSLGGGGTGYLEALFDYLKDEHKDKKKAPMPDADEWELIECQKDCPRQQNSFDCGVFTCMFCDFLSQGGPLTFSQEHITQCRERIALSIMNGVAIM